MELNQMKKDLRSTHNTYQKPAQSPRNNLYSNQRDNYDSYNIQGNNRNDYLLGNSNTRDLVNESRNDYLLPGKTQDVDITRMSINHYNNNNSNYNNYVPPRSMDKNRYSEPVNYNRNDNNSFYNNPSIQPPSNSFMPNQRRDYSPQNQYNNDQSRYESNPNNNIRDIQEPRKSDRQNHKQTEEIEKNQLEQFYGFLKQKEKDIESRINTLPKVCRRVADKREKLQLQKELEEVEKEIQYVQGLLQQ